jgi:hypothetical protein
MDADIKNYLMNFNDRKRKHNNNYDNIKKELYYYCIEGLIKELKQINKNIEGNDINLYFNKMIDNFNNIKKHIDNKIDHMSDLEVFIKAYIIVFIDIINHIKTQKNINGKIKDIIKYLNNYKKQFFIPIKKRKLDEIDIDFNIEETLNTDDTESDDDYEPFIHQRLSLKDKDISEFIKEVKKLEDKSGSSHEDTIKYFINMNSTNKKTFLKLLSDLSTNSNHIPYLFRILKMDLDNDTKINIISKMMTNIHDSG